jgi:hypothetical protein
MLCLVASFYGYAASVCPPQRLDLSEKLSAVEKTASAENVDAYLQAFPKSFPQLMRQLFWESCPAQPAPWEAHVKALDTLFARHSRDVLAAELSASIGGISIADGPNFFQLQVGRHAATDAALFAGELLKFTPEQRESIIEFLVDWERSPTTDNQHLVAELRRLKLNELADSIELAIKVRRLRYNA